MSIESMNVEQEFLLAQIQTLKVKPTAESSFAF